MMVWLKPNQKHMSIASKGANDNNKCQQFQRGIKLDPSIQMIWIYSQLILPFALNLINFYDG